ncbi:MAG: hypothetical protein HZC02_01120 [Candidatus Levybacteria bacterium]|nr:hypothetical protein [Candidatus Levybacteria bacterium]
MREAEIPTYIPTSLDLASEFATLTQELQALIAEDKKEKSEKEKKWWRDSRFNRRDYLLACTPCSRFALGDIKRLEHNARNSNDFLSSLGVNLEEGDAGIWTPIGARRFELRRLIIEAPAQIQGAIAVGAIGIAEREKQYFRNWAIDFNNTYHAPFDSNENLSLVLRTKEARDIWRIKNPLKASPISDGFRRFSMV